MAAAAAAPKTDSLMARLKAETAHLHERIEQVVPLMRPDLDRRGYLSHLSRLLGYLRPLEALLARFEAPWSGFGLDYGARRRSGRLAGDLRALGLAAPEIDALPACTALPAAATLDEAWGCLYVLEGSTLGGQVIQRVLAPRLGLGPETGLGFLSGHGADTAGAWRSFSAAVERFAAGGCDRAAVVRGACETFTTQMAWFQEAARSDGR